MVHLKPLPGSPGYDNDLDGVLKAALKDASALTQGGVDGIMVENYGDVPFFPKRVEPHTIAIMAVILKQISEHTPLPLGVNVLRNDGLGALGVALGGGARFIRVNVFIGTASTDQGIIEGEAHQILRYRNNLSLNTAILADVHVKHSRPMGGELLVEAAQDAFHRGLADALVLTGPATGIETDPKELTAVRKALPEAPIIAGSGVTLENIEEVLAFADGAIVGTSLKEGNDTRAPVDPNRVSDLMKAVKSLRQGL
jgi:membrane complex biogenesis BtpA family protein